MGVSTSERSIAAALPRAGRIAAALFGGLLLAAAALPSARAETIGRILVRLNPETVATGPVAAAQLARLEMLAGTKLTQVGMTRTGALEFSLAEPSDAAAMKARLRAMRQERSVLWAEPAPAKLERTTTRTGSASDPPGDLTTCVARATSTSGARRSAT